MGAMAGGQGAAEGVGLTDDTLRGSNDVPTRPVAHRTARWSGELAALIDTLSESPEEVVWPGTERRHEESRIPGSTEVGHVVYLSYRDLHYIIFGRSKAREQI